MQTRLQYRLDGFLVSSVGNLRNKRVSVVIASRGGHAGVSREAKSPMAIAAHERAPPHTKWRSDRNWKGEKRKRITAVALGMNGAPAGPAVSLKSEHRARHCRRLKGLPVPQLQSFPACKPVPSMLTICSIPSKEERQSEGVGHSSEGNFGSLALAVTSRIQNPCRR